MTEQVKVLDHGYVQLIDTWGRLAVEDAVGDEAFVAAARMSTGKGFLGWGGAGSGLHGQGCGNEDCPGCNTGDEKLLRYLYSNRHMTPFEMGGATFEIQAPIFVFREWHRHRTQSYNEMSARYAPLPNTNYIPTVERLMINAGTGNKQAGTVKDSAELDERSAQAFREMLERQYSSAEELYQAALKNGVPKELARVHLPVGRYSRMRASANLRNWLQFLTLRNDKNAQWEIRQYAQIVQQLLVGVFPRTLELFTEGRP